MNPQELTPETPKIHNPLEVMQPGEQTICEIRRHPIGMFGMYLMSAIILVVLAVLMLVIVPNVFGSSRGSVTAISAIVFLLIACLVIGFVFVANKVYWGNSWIVSSDSLTQINQTSLFNRQSSQLSLGNLEDVTAEQHGVLAQIFKFGTLRVETAGERSKFVFPYCPSPNYYAQKILAAREAFVQAHGISRHEQPGVAADPTPQPQPQPQAPPTVPPAPAFPDTPYDNRQNDFHQQ